MPSLPSSKRFVTTPRSLRRPLDHGMEIALAPPVTRGRGSRAAGGTPPTIPFVSTGQIDGATVEPVNINADHMPVHPRLARIFASCTFTVDVLTPLFPFNRNAFNDYS
jgi:hypothetical protein